MTAKKKNSFLLMLGAATLAYCSLNVWNRTTRQFYKEPSGNMFMMDTLDTTSTIRNMSVNGAIDRTLAPKKVSAIDRILATKNLSMRDAINRNLATRKVSKKDAKNRNLATKNMPANDAINIATFLKNSTLHQYNSICQSCKTDVPNAIVQYGPLRTATTLQFHILCLMMIMVHEDDVENVGCAFNNTPATKYSVTKTHDLSYLEKLPQKTWIFMTSRNGVTQESILSEKRMENKNFTIRYVADLNLVLKRGHFIVHEYQKMFGVTNGQMVHVADYIRYWDVLRLCCGTQMSGKWREVLHRGHGANYKQRTHNGRYHECEMYDISQVEKILMNTFIYRKFAHVISVSGVIGKPSIRDGKLDGNYCTLCNSNIAKYHIRFNRPCIHNT